MIDRGTRDEIKELIRLEIIKLGLGAGGATTFTDLTDVPSTYAAQALKVARVNAGETALEFATVSGTGDVVGPGSATTGAVVLYDGATGKLIKNSTILPTTVGIAIANLANPSAVRFIRINADNTVTARTAAEMLSDIGAQASGSYLTAANIVETITNGVTTNAPSENAVFDALALKAPLVSPAFTTPSLGVATATTINGATITSGTLNGSVTGTNTGDQSFIVGITGTLAQFNTAVTDAELARTDAANTFTGVQTFSTPIAVGSVATMSATVGGGVPTPPNNTTTFLRGDGTFAAPSGGSGDMVLANVQTVTGAKTFGTIGGAVGKLILAGSTSGSTIVNAAAIAGTTTVTVPAQTGTLLINTATSGVGATPTASSTVTITHGLGRIPTIIRIYSGGGFTSNAAATPTTYSIGIYTSSGNACIYQGINGTTTIAAVSSTAFAIYMITSAGNLISGVIGNVGATSFDIVFTETGTHTRGVYMWEAQ